MKRLAALILFLAVQGAGEARAADRLREIRERGHLVCGVAWPPSPRAASDGEGLGVDGEICRATAAAVFGAADRVQFRVLPDLAAFVDDPDVDIVAHNLSWTLSRSHLPEGRFGPVVLHDGQGFLVRPGIVRVVELRGQSVCVHGGGEAALNLAAFARARGLDIAIDQSDDLAQAGRRFLAGECTALSADLTELSAFLAGPGRAGGYGVLPDLVSHEPIAPLVRGDDRFVQIVVWATYALFESEALGVRSSNLDTALARDDLPARRFLRPGPASTDLGLSPGWTTDVVRGVGAYDEVFARQLGPLVNTAHGRGLNRPMGQGGVLYAPPFR